MKIKIRKDARQAYVSHRSSIPFNSKWADLMDKIAGNTYDVETEYLFVDQFNIGKVEGSDLGLRIMNYLVEEVIDDIRPIMQRCNWCGKTSPRKLSSCPHCNHNSHLEKFPTNLSNAEIFIIEANYKGDSSD